jgi:hypothetical protein
MSHPLISRNADLQKLVDDGFEVEIIGGHLVIRSVPYLNAAGQVRRGVMVCQLHVTADITQPITQHVVNWTGDFPHDEMGRPLEKLRHGEAATSITDNLVTKFSFSNKPPEGYRDHYELVTTYVANISGPVQHVDENAKAQTWRVVENHDPESVFMFADTASSRAGITAVTRKLQTGPVAIVGLGGTGSYVLDLMAKTPVPELHIFDGDRFGQHNAFRAPGAPTIEQLKARPFKVDYFTETYSRMRRGIIPHPLHIDASTVSRLEGMSFVFICMDVGTAKRLIVDRLVQHGVPFVDVGMGVQISDNNGLRGILRVTTVTAEKANHVGARISFTEDGNNVYDQNIQIADLNALNAALAVLRWKKLCGFYEDLKKEHFSAYSIDVGTLVNEDMP